MNIQNNTTAGAEPAATPDHPNLTLALKLAVAGMPVFPCLEAEGLAHDKDGKPKGAKAPYTGGGFKDASTDTARIKSWWALWPAAVPGMPTGAATGIAVIDGDLDRDTGEAVGENQIAELGLDHPDAIKVRTQSGGVQILYRHVAGAATGSKKLASKIDTRGEGGYIIAPGARMQDGATYRYEGRTLSEALAAGDLPPYPLEAVEAAIKAEAERKRAKTQGPKIDTGQGDGQTEATDAETLEVVRRLLAEAPNHLCREDWVKLALSLRVAYGESLREAFTTFSLRYNGGQPCTAQDAMHVWQSSGAARTVTGIGPALALLRDAVGQRRFKDIFAEVFAETRPDAKKSGKGGGKPKGQPLIDTDLTEDGVALSFTKRYGGKMRFDHDQGRWFEWQGDRWKPDNTHLAYSYCRQIARELSEDLKEGQRAPFRKAAFAAGVERMARADRAHAATSDGWDNDPFMLGCPGVTVDLRTGKHLTPDPAHGITKQAAVRPAAGDCPLWRAFLLEVCEGDAEMVRFLQQWSGYCLTGDTREHALLFVYGPGGNGKSVLLETVTYILGEYAATASMDTFTASKHSQHLTFMAMLRGARLVTASETEEGKAWAETKIKQVTGGDRITANFMRQDAFTFTPQFKLTVVGNHKPVLKNVDDAARRRFNIVPFTVKPKNPDRELTAKLRAEAPAILQWMIAGCLDWQANGLVRPSRVKEATAEYFDDQDQIGQWLDENCRIEPHNLSLSATPTALFNNWKMYALAAGEDPGTQAALLNVLAKRGLTRHVRKVGGKPQRFWRGIELYYPASHHQ